MAALSTKVISTLHLRGVEKRDDVHGAQYFFSPTGLYWLFNLLYERESNGRKFLLSNELLKSVATTSPGKDWRSLRIKACELPIYDGSGFQLAFYLNGTPPRMLHNSSPLNVIGGDISFIDRSGVLAAPSGTSVFLKLNEEEIQILSSGGFLERDSTSNR